MPLAGRWSNGRERRGSDVAVRLKVCCVLVLLLLLLRCRLFFLPLAILRILTLAMPMPHCPLATSQPSFGFLSRPKPCALIKLYVLLRTPSKRQEAVGATVS
eukprot:scaffold8703_cov140-Isochrysis_galbana.AAC.3